MWKYLVVMLLISSPLLAENAKDRGTPSGHAARSHDPKSAKQIEAAKLDAEYQAQVDAWNDFTSTNRVASYFEAEQLNDQYETDAKLALERKTVSRNYQVQDPVTDFGQCCPTDDNNDGFVDGTANDVDGIGGIP